MKNFQWLPDKNGKSEPHWLELIGTSDGDDNDYWWAAHLKWDGCFYLFHAGNLPFCVEYGTPSSKRDPKACDEEIHICHMDELIDLLTKLRDAARAHFNNEYWE